MNLPRLKCSKFDFQIALSIDIALCRMADVSGIRIAHALSIPFYH